MQRPTLRLEALTHKSKLSELQQKFIFCDVCKVVYDRKTEVRIGSCAQFWLAELLHCMAWLPEDQWRLVITRSHHALSRRIMEAVNADPSMTGKAPPVIQIVFLDGKYAMWTGNEGLMELKSGDDLAKLTCPPVESAAYNMLELVRRELHRCKPIEHELGL